MNFGGLFSLRWSGNHFDEEKFKEALSVLGLQYSSEQLIEHIIQTAERGETGLSHHGNKTQQEKFVQLATESGISVEILGKALPQETIDLFKSYQKESNQ